MGLFTHVWKRHVTQNPDYYQAYLNFPIEKGDRSFVGAVQRQIDTLTNLVDGRLDVYARADETVVRTDSVSADQFDCPSFERLIERVEDLYRDEYVLACHTKWRRHDNGLEKAYVVVPVEPLFSTRKRKSANGHPLTTE